MLNNGGRLTIIETVEIDQRSGRPRRLTYTYGYQDCTGKTMFRYERDPHNKSLHSIKHHEYHLHVGEDDDPRYRTQPVNPYWIVSFIEQCFQNE